MVAVNMEQLFGKALKLIEKGKNPEAFEILKELVENTPSSIYEIEPRYLSYYGYLTGIVSHNYQHGIELCSEAIKKEFFHPEFYLNLGRLYFAVDNRHMAIKTFRRGLQIDKTDEAIKNELKEMGMRKMPVFSFLKRENPVNKLVGKIRTLFYWIIKGKK